jgi:hypothetical protein
MGGGATEMRGLRAGFFLRFGVTGVDFADGLDVFSRLALTTRLRRTDAFFGAVFVLAARVGCCFFSTTLLDALRTFFRGAIRFRLGPPATFSFVLGGARFCPWISLATSSFNKVNFLLSARFSFSSFLRALRSFFAWCFMIRIAPASTATVSASRPPGVNEEQLRSPPGWCEYFRSPLI